MALKLFLLFVQSIDVLFIRKKYIVFGSRAGRGYADNAQYLYEYYLSRGKEVYFITRNKEELYNIPGEPIYAYSLKAAYIMLRSKTLFCTHGRSDFFPYKLKPIYGREVINLWHGIPGKKVGDRSPRQRREIRHWNKFIVSSDFEAEFLSKQFEMDLNRFLVVGQPRTDKLWEYKQPQTGRANSLILYAPTFRDQDCVRLFPFEDVDLHSIDKFLKLNNQEIHIRVHPNDEKYFRDLGYNEKYENIKVVNPAEEQSINDVLHRYGKLITDYSGIALDFLILDRPIAYIPYDYSSYEKHRGFSYNYHEHLAGVILTNQVDLFNFLETEDNAISNKRNAMLLKFHKFRDGKSSERIYEIFEAKN